MLNCVRQLADNCTVDFEVTRAMEPFLAHKADKIDKFLEAALTLAQPKNPSFLERYIEQYLRSVHRKTEFMMFADTIPINYGSTLTKVALFFSKLAIYVLCPYYVP